MKNEGDVPEVRDAAAQGGNADGQGGCPTHAGLPGRPGITGASDAGHTLALGAEPSHEQPFQDVGESQHGTRNKVARSILDHGPSTAADLASRLELTPAAVRRHLDALVAEGVVEARKQRVYGSRGRGRPARAFALTDAGRDAFYQAYDELAVDALRWIARQAGGGERGSAAVAEFARARFAAQVQRYSAALEVAEPHARTRVLAEALTADGYAAVAGSAPAPRRGAPGPVGEQLCQHHCPVVHVAERFPQLCEAETEAFSRLLGTHVQRLATIAHGDGVCTTFVPAPQAARHRAQSADGVGVPSGSPGSDPTGPPGDLADIRADRREHTSVTPKHTASAHKAGRNPV